MSSRPTCYACLRPAEHCLCAAITPVANRTPVLIVQHPRERAHPFNTARLAQRCLSEVEVFVRQPGSGTDDTLESALGSCGLLYPGPESVDLSKARPEQLPAKLVVIDGTWRHARALLRATPALQDLPKYTLPGGLESGFQIRKQPADYCLSTLEAIHHALRCIEPRTPGLDTMLRPFEEMQVRQLIAMKAGVPRSKTRLSRRKSRRIPRPLTEDFENLVVAYAESTTVGPIGRPRQLLAVAAARPATGERLSVVLEPGEVREERLAYLRLSPEDLQGAVDHDAFRRSWHAFLRPGDVLGAWSKSSLDALAPYTPPLPPPLLVRGTYFNLQREKGALEDILVQEELCTSEQIASQRAHSNRPSERLEHTLRMCRFLRDQAPA